MTQSLHTNGGARWACPAEKPGRGGPAEQGRGTRGLNESTQLGITFKQKLRTSSRCLSVPLRPAAKENPGIAAGHAQNLVALIPTKSLPWEARALAVLKAPQVLLDLQCPEVATGHVSLLSDTWWTPD